MSKTALINAGAVAVIIAVSVPVHYFGGLDWPWAIVIGAATSIVLRWLIHSGRHEEATADSGTVARN